MTDKQTNRFRKIIDFPLLCDIYSPSILLVFINYLISYHDFDIYHKLMT